MWMCVVALTPLSERSARIGETSAGPAGAGAPPTTVLRTNCVEQLDGKHCLPSALDVSGVGGIFIIIY